MKFRIIKKTYWNNRVSYIPQVQIEEYDGMDNVLVWANIGYDILHDSILTKLDEKRAGTNNVFSAKKVIEDYKSFKAFTPIEEVVETF